MKAKGDQWLGIDIGGANLKVSDAAGQALNQVFQLWQRPESLSMTIKSLVAAHREKYPNSAWQSIALTMTGELADCYQTKAEGVAEIIYATVSALSPLPVRIATVDDQWLTPPEAITKPTKVAAANWRLTARLLANHHLLQKSDAVSLLIDIGSTTADLIPLKYQQVISLGSTDTERLINHELVYTGVRRTPICSLVSEIPYRGNKCPIASEWFATTADVWLLLGKIKPDENDTHTADNRPLTLPYAIDRLARCVCTDRSEFTHDDAVHAAQHIARAQTQRIAAAIQKSAWDESHPVYVGGEGEFLARRVIESILPSASIISLGETIGSVASQCGPAYAAAYLAGVEC